MPRQHYTFEDNLNGHSINTDKAKGLGCIVEVADGYLQRLKYMTDNKRQVFVMQCVATVPEGMEFPKDNKAITKCLASFIKTSKNKGLCPQVGWTREQETSDHQHYNIGAIFDGSLTQSARGHAERLNKLWTKCLGVDPGSKYIHRVEPDSEKYDKQATCDKKSLTGIKIVPNAPGAAEQFDNALHFLSYGAKLSQKGKAPHGQREYGFTCLPKDNGQDKQQGGDQSDTDDVRD